MNAKIIFYLISFLLFFPSCNKNEDETPQPVSNLSNCMVKELRIDSEGMFWTAEYSNGRILKLNYYESGSLEEVTTYTYDDDTLRISYADDYEEIFRKVKIGANGLAESETMISINSNYTSYDTISYSYNSDGYLIEKYQRQLMDHASPYDHVDTIVTTYIFTDGNKISESVTEGGVTKTSYFEYYLDKENKSQLDEYGFPLFGISYFGKPNKNVIKKITYSRNADTDFMNYDFDDNGFVSKIELTYDYSPTIFFVEGTLNYTCQ